MMQFRPNSRRLPLRAALLLAAVAIYLPAPTVATAEPSDSVRGLRVRQRANGLPGQPKEESSLQELSVTKDRLRLFDRATDITYLLRLDKSPPVIWKVSADGKEYSHAKELQDIQKDRDLIEKQTLQGILQGSDSAEHKAFDLEALHLREDGRRVVTLEEIPAQGERLLDHAVKRYRVIENGRVVVDARCTQELPEPLPLFEFYRHVGAFSDEVLEKLREIPGIPLQAEITVVTATLNYKIRAEVEALRVAEDIPSSEFELPPGAVELKESPTAPCGTCGTEVERAAPGERATIDGRKLFFCGKECLKEWKKRFREGLRKDPAGAAKRDPPPGEARPPEKTPGADH